MAAAQAVVEREEGALELVALALGEMVVVGVVVEVKAEEVQE